MRNWLKALSILFAFLLLAAMPVVAQVNSVVTGGLNGTVIDTSGAVVAEAAVTIQGPQGSHVMKTNSLGSFGFAGLIPGDYDVTVEKTGYKKYHSTHNQVVVNVSSLLNVTLTVGSAAETVEVSASAVSIDTQSTAIDANLSDVFYNNVPLGRTVSAIFYAAPSAASGQVAGTANQAGPGSANPSIGGSSGLENLYVVDGVTITDPAYGSLGTYNINHGSLGTGINLAFIKEVDIKSYGFEPQYGKSMGGILQIVTKSGSHDFHGALAAYMGPGWGFAARKQFYQFGYIQTKPSGTLSSPHYDLAAEFGGYIPHFRDKIFFFGAFNPALDQNVNIANPNYSYPGQPSAGPAVVTHGPWYYSTTGMSWAGKFDFQLSPRITFDAAAFGDPSRHNSIPNTLSTSNIANSLSSYHWGSTDTFFRLNATITPTWVANGSFTYNRDTFTEIPSVNVYQISDQSLLAQSRGGISTTGFGSFIPTNEDTYSIAVSTQKTARFFGEHTIGVGYSYDHTRFFYNTSRSGALFTIPDKNAAGTTLTTLFSNIPAKSAGQKTNATFSVFATNANDLTDTTCTQCPTWNGSKVYASETRGTYNGFGVHSRARYHAAFGNDTWVMNRFITIDAGVRWEEERIGAGTFSYPFTGNWSPRLGLNVDPVGDRKGKIFVSYGRNFWALPLDAANRELGNEQDDTAFYFAPTIVNNALVIVPDNAHNLNGLPKATNSGSVSTFGAPNFSSSTAAEGILPGTKSEYETEWVLGIEREVRNGMVLKAHYIQRSLPRIIEDIGSNSPEGSTITGNYNGGIANPSSSTDIAVNENEITYTPAQWAAANPLAGQVGWVYAPPDTNKQCTKGTDTYFSAGGIWVDGNNSPVGGACFLNLSTMDNGPGDGKSDGFVNPQREYKALELELDKRYSNHWLAIVNYRFANLWGNYEGAYRNDNGQSDPGISSLFDFTTGKLNLLGDQFKPGYLSTDRRNVAGLFASYSVGPDTPVVHALKGLTAGMTVRGQSGIPLSLLGDHPAYLNTGEVPIGGRGAAGRSPANIELDMRSEYTIPIHDMANIKLAFDGFNVTNSQQILSKVQTTQQTASGYPVVGSAPSLNQDYSRPTQFQLPFRAQFTIRIEY